MDLPAGQGRGDLASLPWRTQQQTERRIAGGRGSLRRKVQPTRRGHRQAAAIDDHRGHAVVSDRLLDHPGNAVGTSPSASPPQRRGGFWDLREPRCLQQPQIGRGRSGIASASSASPIGIAAASRVLPGDGESPVKLAAKPAHQRPRMRMDARPDPQNPPLWRALRPEPPCGRAI